MEGEAIFIQINQQLSLLPTSQSESFISRVHDQLRKVNEKAYDPEIIAIGPYHQGKSSLKVMEQHKRLYLKSLLERNNTSVQIYVSAVRSLEEKARKCYHELPELNASEFISMLMLDGCFIVELLRKFSIPSLRCNNDPIFKEPWIMIALQRDLILFENQIPFFVLFTLFSMIQEQNPPNLNINFIELVMRFFSDLLPGHGHRQILFENWHDETKNLLELVHDNWLPKFAGNELPGRALNNQEIWSISSATKLSEAGVEFIKGDEEECLLDIKFRDGKMQIPRLLIDGRTECFFRNLIAHEEYHENIRHRHIVSYAKLLNCLIRSPEDVEILCESKIIVHSFGQSADVSEIFNKIHNSVTEPSSHFHYIGVFKEVNDYCSRRVNRWKARFKQKHLSSPWEVISIIAAFTLLLLTLVQSVFAVLSYK